MPNPAGDPIWSPDNKSMIISVGTYGSFHESPPDTGDQPIIGLLSLDGTFRPLLTWNELFPGEEKPEMVQPFGGFGPTWSPDGKKIAFITYNRYAHPEEDRLWIMDVNSGEKTLIYSGYLGGDPRWSPDGKNIAFEKSAVNNSFSAYERSIVIFDIETKRQKTAVKFMEESSSGRFDVPLIWSPKGDRLAFGYFSPDISRWGVYVLDIVTGATIKAVDYEDEPTPILWTMDGNCLLVEKFDLSALYLKCVD